MGKFKKLLLASSVMCFSSLGLASGSQAQSDYYGISPFEGFYAGAYVGGMLDPTAVTTVGGMAGVNFVLTDNILAGVEMQGGATLNDPATYDALMLGRVGYELNDMTLLYGAAGGGVINNIGSYAIGGGAEIIAIDNVGVRAEALGTGSWGAGLNASKLTLGAMWYVQ